MKKKQVNKVFKNKKEELEYWDSLDFVEYLKNKKSVKNEFPNLKPTTKSIPIRLPISN